MNPTILHSAGIDYAGGLARFVGNKAMYEKFLIKFSQYGYLLDLQTQIEAGQIDKAFRTAHTLKGTAGNLSMRRLYEAVSPLVETLRENDLTGVQQRLMEVRLAYNEVVAAIERARF